MRKPLMAALASGLIVVSHGLAAVQRGDDPQQDIQAVYNRASAATVSAKTYADAEAIHKWLDTPDCTFTTFMQPARTWAQMRSEVEASLATPLSGLSSVIRKLEITGSPTAIATTVVEGKARIVDEAGQFGAKGAAHDIVTRATVRDVWVKSPDGWRRKSHEKLTPTGVASVDGKPPTLAARKSQG
jgi:hypothetical protein